MCIVTMDEFTRTCRQMRKPDTVPELSRPRTRSSQRLTLTPRSPSDGQTTQPSSSP